jgi:endonuclease YncB( thermonuclease family)
MVLTRWEKTPDGRYYALIWVEYEKDKWKYLSELLVRRGYARVDGLTTPIPNTKLNEDDYLQLLQMGAKYARQNKLGIWSKAKN